MDGAKVERVVRGDEPGVVHLHGYWDRPESVILGIRSYEQVLGDAHAQTMQQAIRSLKTLLFVGCREGLLDPNFGALLEWSAKVFAGSEYRHFLLTRESEVAALQSQRLPGNGSWFCPMGTTSATWLPFCAACGLALEPDRKPKQVHLHPDKRRCFRLRRAVSVERLKSRTSFPRSWLLLRCRCLCSDRRASAKAPSRWWP